MFLLILLPALLQNSIQQDISSITDLKTLSELPLEKLLKLKNNFDLEDEPTEEDAISTRLKVKGDNPEALGLQAKRKPYNRGGYEMEYYKKKGDKKDANSIFQMSVTTLAFVAFGGYLLCLIVQAIRAKNNTMATDNSDMLALLVKPPRPTRIRNPQKQTKPGRRPRPGNNRYKREVWPDANPQGMYDALIMLAEGYSKYYIIDYKSFNHTIKPYS